MEPEEEKALQIKELTRQELTQCQHCFKSRVEQGVKLFKCAGCQIMLYCSKECQKAQWPSHKSMCRINQNRRNIMSALGQGDNFKALRAYCGKHRPAMAHWGMRALDLGVDTTSAMRNVVLIKVRAVPKETRVERSFRALTAEVVPATSEMFGGEGSELSKQLVILNTEQRCQGQIGGIMVLVHDVDTGFSNVCPTGFGKEVLTLKRGTPWKAELLRSMNPEWNDKN